MSREKILDTLIKIKITGLTHDIPGPEEGPELKYLRTNQPLWLSL